LRATMTGRGLAAGAVGAAAGVRATEAEAAEGASDAAAGVRATEAEVAGLAPAEPDEADGPPAARAGGGGAPRGGAEGPGGGAAGCGGGGRCRAGGSRRCGRTLDGLAGEAATGGRLGRAGIGSASGLGGGREGVDVGLGKTRRRGRRATLAGGGFREARRGR